MSGMISRMAYIWLVTTEVFEELLYQTVGEFFRHFIAVSETRKEAWRIQPKKFNTPTPLAKATDTA